MAERTFEAFAHEVKDSCSSFAKKKNYTTEGIDGDNQLLNICSALGIHREHAIGEIIYKAAEFLKNPRPILLVKISGWCFILWRTLPTEE